MTLPQLFSQDPNPATAGVKVKICYSGDRPWAATITWSDATTTAISGAGACVVVLIPAGVTGGIVVDDHGESLDYVIEIGSPLGLWSRLRRWLGLGKPEASPAPLPHP